VGLLPTLATYHNKQQKTKKHHHKLSKKMFLTQEYFYLPTFLFFYRGKSYEVI